MGIRRFATENATASPPVSVTATGSFDAIVAGDSDTLLKPLQLIFTNTSASDATIAIYEETEKISSFDLNTQTVIWNVPDGFALTQGSGLTANLENGTSVEVVAIYLPFDFTAPITKEQARASGLATGNATATRTPNFFGGQSKT